MKRVSLVARLISLASFLISIFSSASAQSQQELPRAEEVINKALERAKWAAIQSPAGKYVWTELRVTEKLDDKAAVKERVARVYQVFPIEGVLYSKLIQKDGKPLSEKELKAEQERETKFRQTLAERQPRRRNAEPFFNRQLTDKYQFEMVGREPIQGRPSFILTFKPKSKDLPVKRREDSVLNKLVGKIWIDQEEYELAKAEAHLPEKVTLWGGIMATVRKFDLWLEATKVDEGVWFLSQLEQYIDGRLLFSSVREKQERQSRDFKKVVPEVGKTTTGTP